MNKLAKTVGMILAIGMVAGPMVACGGASEKGAEVPSADDGEKKSLKKFEGNRMETDDAAVEE